MTRRSIGGRARGAAAFAMLAWVSAGALAQSVGTTKPGHALDLGPARAIPPLELATELAASGFAKITWVGAPAGDLERIFVLEQFTGLVRIARNGAPEPTPFLDLSGKILASGESGLLTLAFHPDYADNGRIFVVYNDLNGAWTLERFRVVPPSADVAQAGSGTVLLSIPKDLTQHNGSMLGFGLDGYLYASTGDGGGGNDPDDNGQNLASLLGKLLRIDVDSPSGLYAVPPTNPFVGVPGARPEIWAYGLRNPWRFSIDAQTGDIYIGDVGQDEREEVNFLPAGQGGLNFGWDCMEGTLCTGSGACGACPSSAFSDPIHEFTHSVGCSITGGVLYRGTALPELSGTYFCADLCTAQVWTFRYVNGALSDFTDRTSVLQPPASSLGFISTMGTDGAGEVLIADYGSGRIWRVVESDPLADCDSDGLLDHQEIEEGSSFDANLNGKPDECELLLTSSDLFFGQPAELTFIGAQPDEVVTFFYSPRGTGTGPCVFDGNLCLDLLPILQGGQPVVPIAGTASADAQGRAVLVWSVPASFGGGADHVALQAGVDRGPDSVKSNVVWKSVE